MKGKKKITILISGAEDEWRTLNIGWIEQKIKRYKFNAFIDAIRVRLWEMLSHVRNKLTASSKHRERGGMKDNGVDARVGPFKGLK